MEKANQEPFILYLRKIGKNPVLTPEKENEVFRKIKEGDPKARNLMINSNLRLVVAIAKQIRTGQELPDLIAEGNIALIKAVDAFNITEGVKFSSFAGLCIKRQIFKALNTSYSTIRKPATQLKKIKEIKRISDEFKQENFREPYNEELAVIMGTTPKEIQLMKIVAVTPTSLNIPIGGQAAELGEIIEDEHQISPLLQLLQKTRAAEIIKSLEELKPKKKQVLYLRYGLNLQDPKTLADIAEIMNISPERVRQIENEALMELRISMRQKQKKESTQITS